MMSQVHLHCVSKIYSGHEQEDLLPLSATGRSGFVPSWTQKPKNQDLQAQVVLICVNICVP